MRFRIGVGTISLALMITLGMAPGAFAQDSQSLTEKEAKTLLKQSEKSLKKAQKAAKQGKSDEAVKHASAYAENMNQLNQGLVASQMDDEHALEIAAKVDDATLKHESVLMDVLERVPDQAKPAIMDALEASRRGHDTATVAIVRRGQPDLPNGMLTKEAAKDAMQKNEALIEHAQRAQKRGDSTALNLAVGRFADNMETIEQAMQSGAVDASDPVSVFDRVNDSTRKHLSKLEDLMEKVPEQALPGIQRAIDNSARGNQMALEALQRSRAAETQTGRHNGPGLPASIGSSAGTPGQPAGVGGRPGSPPGGPPSGRPGGRPPR